jgi:hypothetical protein
LAKAELPEGQALGFELKQPVSVIIMASQTQRKSVLTDLIDFIVTPFFFVQQQAAKPQVKPKLNQF